MVACAGRKRAPPARGVCWFIIWSKLFSLPGTYGRHRYRRGNLWQSLEDAPGKKTQNTVLKIMPLRLDWPKMCIHVDPWHLWGFSGAENAAMVVTEFPQMVRYWTVLQYRVHHDGQILNRFYRTVQSTPCWSDIEQILQYRVHHVGRRVRSSSRDKGPMMPKIKSI